MDRVAKFAQIVRKGTTMNMKVCGCTISKMAAASAGTTMKSFMLDSGAKISVMEKERCSIAKESVIRVNGATILETDMVHSGQVTLASKACGSKTRNMALESIIVAAKARKKLFMKRNGITVVWLNQKESTQ